jgi:hypothetical protein
MDNKKSGRKRKGTIINRNKRFFLMSSVCAATDAKMPLNLIPDRVIYWY